MFGHDYQPKKDRCITMTTNFLSFDNLGYSWRHHDMKTLSTLLALCERNLPVVISLTSSTKDKQCKPLMFTSLLAETNCWAISRVAHDLGVSSVNGKMIWFIWHENILLIVLNLTCDIMIKLCCYVIQCTRYLWGTSQGMSGGPWGRFKNTYELLNLRALKFSYVNKIHIFQCMGKIFCVEFQRYPLKFHTKYLTHTLKDMIFMQFLNFKSS